jgi:hypothetical protein
MNKKHTALEKILNFEGLNRLRNNDPYRLYGNHTQSSVLTQPSSITLISNYFKLFFDGTQGAT